MAANLPRRIVKETQRLLQDPVPGISAIPDDNNARYFHVVIAGPEGSPFAGGVFKVNQLKQWLQLNCIETLS